MNFGHWLVSFSLVWTCICGVLTKLLVQETFSRWRPFSAVVRYVYSLNTEVGIWHVLIPVSCSFCWPELWNSYKCNIDIWFSVMDGWKKGHLCVLTDVPVRKKMLEFYLFMRTSWQIILNARVFIGWRRLGYWNGVHSGYSNVLHSRRTLLSIWLRAGSSVWRWDPRTGVFPVIPSRIIWGGGCYWHAIWSWGKCWCYCLPSLPPPPFLVDQAVIRKLSSETRQRR